MEHLPQQTFLYEALLSGGTEAAVILHFICYLAFHLLSCISSGIVPFDAFAEAVSDSEPGGVQSISLVL